MFVFKIFIKYVWLLCPILSVLCIYLPIGLYWFDMGYHSMWQVSIHMRKIPRNSRAPVYPLPQFMRKTCTILLYQPTSYLTSTSPVRSLYLSLITGKAGFSVTVCDLSLNAGSGAGGVRLISLSPRLRLLLWDPVKTHNYWVFFTVPKETVDYSTLGIKGCSWNIKAAETFILKEEWSTGKLNPIF